jgi:predicted aminopeptidase
MRPLKTLLIPILLLLGACSPVYVLRAGWEEAKILRRREPIAELVTDSTVAPARRAKLELVLRARAFAKDSLALDVGDSYTTFSQLDSDTLALILSAAERTTFEPYEWWFPIVGHVPYKGFFSEEAAREVIEDLEEEGFDTYLRPTSAFSTLGWFNDPLVSPLLRYDSIQLANTVIHELFHNTLYLSGEAMFNESLANFVGARGAIGLFCGTYGEGSRLCHQARAMWEDQLIFGRFLSALVAELEALYAREDLTRKQKLVLREKVFRGAQREFAEEVQPRFQVLSFADFTQIPLNNATLIARRIYYRQLDLFERVFEQSGENLAATIAAIVEVAEDADNPYAAVAGLVQRR